MSARSAIAAASLKRGLPLLVVVLGLAVSASPASAAQTHVFQGAIGSGELTAPAGLAVDNASGDLYIADPGTGMVARFSSTGALAPFTSSATNQLGPFALVSGVTQQIAVDNSSGASAPNAGDLYVIDGTTLRAFTAAGGPAPFTATAPYIEGNAITGTSEGPFSYAASVSVDSKGDIYVVDANESEIRIFAPSGEFITSVGSTFPDIAAPDTTGLIYSGYGEFELFEAFTPSEYPPTASATYQASVPPFKLGSALAVDPGNNQVYDSDAATTSQASSVSQYTSGAAKNGLISRFGAAQLTAGVAGLAVGRAAGPQEGDVYVSTGDHVVRFGPLVTLPDVVTGLASAVGPGAHVATLNGTVSPNGVETTECQFEYGPTAAYGQIAPCEEDATEIGVGPEPVEVHAKLSGLPGGTVHYRLSAGNPNGSLQGEDQIFGPPTIAGESAAPGQAEAELSAEINPGGLRTSYGFEYGLTAAYGTSTQTATIAAGAATVRAALGVVGLAPNTTYHFRAVATNSVETVRGPDATFTTGSPALGGGCPNEALRVGLSALLPECRAYEMVSPVEKNGGAVYPFFNTVSTSSGDGVEFLSSAAFSGAPANSVNAYIARRGEGGWETTGIDAPQTDPSGLIEITSLGTSEDFSQTFQASRRALAPGATEGGSNIYIRNNLTGSRTLIATEPEKFLFEEFGNGTPRALAGSFNWSKFFFTSERVLAPGAVANQTNAYEFAGGTLSLLTLPGGAGEPAEPALVAGVSRDGNRVLLEGATSRVLYLQQGNGKPVPISASRRAGEAGQLTAVEVDDATPDGSVVFFVDAAPLTEDSNPLAGPSLYRYDVRTDSLEDLTPIENAEVHTILGISDDGSRAFVAAGSALEPGSTPAPQLATNIFAWHSGGFQFVAQTDPKTFETTSPVASTSSPNGLYLGIGSFSELTSEDVPSPACPAVPNSSTPGEDCRDVYLYDAVSEKLTCVSCHGAAAGNSTLGTSDSPPKLQGNQTRDVLDNGEVLFNTPNRLVPRDTNGVGDVYGWRNGQPILISTGTSPDESRFSDATPSGSDIYFHTSQRLVGQDVDSRVDLYDARVDGGIAAQNPPPPPAPCEGQACKGTASSPPPPLTSSVHEGRCESFGGRARRARAQARRFAKRAAGAPAKSAKALRRRAAGEHRRAKQLNGKANQCRRQGK
jgi:hypothetical protein